MRSFASARDRVGNVALKGRTLLVPSMHPAGAEFLAASFRAIGVPALVMETGTGLGVGREQTSGKECFPCQVTLGDVLHHLQGERVRLGPAFDARNYAYFLPEATGPCRFGMYNKFQRLVLDRFEELREMPIASITTADSYSAEGLVPAADATRFRLMIFMTMLVADALDRILWRARPYEGRAGAVETLHAAAVAAMVRVIEKGGLRSDFRDFHGVVADTARAARGLVDPALPRRPRIGIVGEIYLRSHPFSNQDLVLELERHGAEVVNATLAEWVSFISGRGSASTAGAPDDICAPGIRRSAASGPCVAWSRGRVPLSQRQAPRRIRAGAAASRHCPGPRRPRGRAASGRRATFLGRHRHRGDAEHRRRARVRRARLRWHRERLPVHLHARHHGYGRDRPVACENAGTLPGGPVRRHPPGEPGDADPHVRLAGGAAPLFLKGRTDESTLDQSL
jgi:hypothetical protein